MKHLRQEDFSGETNENVPEDKIDRLFMQLEQIEPPSSLMENILTSIARLPRPQLLPEVGEAGTVQKSLEGLIVRVHLQPS